MIDITTGQDRSIDLTSAGGVLFSEKEHTYQNGMGIRYSGITTLIGKYHKHFDNEIVSLNKAIKDNIIETYGERMFQEKTELGKIPELKDYYRKTMLNAVIKKVYIEFFGEEKYMALEKRARGPKNLYPLFESLTTNEEDENFSKELILEMRRAEIKMRFGLKKYRAFKTPVGGFHNLYTKLPEIQINKPNLYDLIIRNAEILKAEWKETNRVSKEEGSATHDIREQQIYVDGGYLYDGVFYKYVEGKNITNVTIDDVIVIPECLVWNHEMKLGGLADIFLFNKGVISVLDYKTNREIEITTEFPDYMFGPCSELLNLNYYHYSLQLKMYQLMAIMIRPEFSVGTNKLIYTSSVRHYRDNDEILNCYDVNKTTNIVMAVFKELGCTDKLIYEGVKEENVMENLFNL